MVFCTHCGAGIDGKGFCTACGKPAAPPVPVPPPPKPDGFKGRLAVTAKTAHGPLPAAALYAFGAIVGVLLVVLGMAMRQHWRNGILFSAIGLVFCAELTIVTLIYRIPRSITVYEFGIEYKIRRAFNKSEWLPWAALLNYQWQGDILSYSFDRKTIIGLSHGWQRSSWPVERFPKAIRIPAQQVSEVAELLRHRAPPPR
jgi:hypothetical protein